MADRKKESSSGESRGERDLNKIIRDPEHGDQVAFAFQQRARGTLPWELWTVTSVEEDGTVTCQVWAGKDMEEELKAPLQGSPFRLLEDVVFPRDYRGGKIKKRWETKSKKDWAQLLRGESDGFFVDSVYRSYFRSAEEARIRAEREAEKYRNSPEGRKARRERDERIGTNPRIGDKLHWTTRDRRGEIVGVTWEVEDILDGPRESREERAEPFVVVEWYDEAEYLRRRASESSRTLEVLRYRPKNRKFNTVPLSKWQTFILDGEKGWEHEGLMWRLQGRQDGSFQEKLQRDVEQLQRAETIPAQASWKDPAIGDELIFADKVCCIVGFSENVRSPIMISVHFIDSLVSELRDTKLAREIPLQDWKDLARQRQLCEARYLGSIPREQETLTQFREKQTEGRDTEEFRERCRRLRENPHENDWLHLYRSEIYRWTMGEPDIDEVIISVKEVRKDGVTAEIRQKRNEGKYVVQKPRESSESKDEDASLLPTKTSGGRNNSGDRRASLVWLEQMNKAELVIFTPEAWQELIATLVPENMFVMGVKISLVP